MIIEFTVFGNQEGNFKNPAAYHSAQPTQRVTIIQDQYGNQISKKTTYLPSFDKQVKKYHKYCQHVRDTLAIKLKAFPAIRNDLLAGKRIQIASNIKTRIYHLNMIYFANDARGDAENVSKGIIDAIHKQDKYVEGAFPFDYDKERPRVEVFITNEVQAYRDRFNKFYDDREARWLL